MDKLKDWLKRITSVSISCSLVTLLFALLFALYDLPWAVFALACGMVLLGLLIYIVLCWVNFGRERQELQLREDLEARNAALNEAILKERAEIQEYFLTWVHQMKTPITASRLILDTAEDTEYRRALGRELVYIENYTQMAMGYLKLLDCEKDLDICALDLDEILRSLLKRYALLFIDKQISLNYEALQVTVLSDSVWLTLLLDQLLSNAVKYNKRGGSVSIAFEQETRTLSIVDSGTGIKAEDLPRIFERGFAGFNGRLGEQSSGLGLFLAQSIAKRLGIVLSVSSEFGHGSAFSLSFPSA